MPMQQGKGGPVPMNMQQQPPNELQLLHQQLRQQNARRMSQEAGFTRFQRHDLGNPLNDYYEIRP